MHWTEVLNELHNTPSPFDIIRRKYLLALNKKTNRNAIAYYSGWLQKQSLAPHGVSFSLDELDKGGFMTAIHGLERKHGLDLVLHTPGGSITALEGLVNYLRQMFGTDIRAIVPQIAMSAGTMLALTCKEIILGKHSSLGPIDPQVGGMPAHGIIEEAQRAVTEIKTNPQLAAFWQPIIAKYQPTLLGACDKAITLSETLVTTWLETGMFAGDKDATKKAKKIVDGLGKLTSTLTHDRRIDVDGAEKLGIKVIRLEADQELQDIVLSTHHAYTQTLAETSVTRIIENHNGIAYMQSHRPTR
jgi:Serine dehydrogenase proteinase